MKNWIKSNRILRPIAKFVYFRLIAPFKFFSGSENYWVKRYQSGGNSGSGSYGKLAKFKAKILNGIVTDNKINTVIEYGCGDGNQLRFSNYPSYIGFDVSPEIIEKCTNSFIKDDTKKFKLVSEYLNEQAELVLSLDVVYHLVENEIYLSYMERLFESSTRFVIIYSSNTDNQNKPQADHVMHRNFSKWVEKNKQEWCLLEYIPNIFPNMEDDIKGSSADFYIYEKRK